LDKKYKASLFFREAFLISLNRVGQLKDSLEGTILHLRIPVFNDTGFRFFFRIWILLSDWFFSDRICWTFRIRFGFSWIGIGFLVFQGFGSGLGFRGTIRSVSLDEGFIGFSRLQDLGVQLFLWFF
jgi:hypothetical protein